MRVLHVVDSLSVDTGGPARTVPALCENVVALGIETHLAFLSRSPQLLFRDDPPQVQLHQLQPGGRLRRVGGGLANQLVQLCEQHPFDIIHAHGMWLPINHAARVAAERTNTKYVLTPRGMLSPWAMGFGAWKKALAWRLYGKGDVWAADVVHATADQEAAELRDMGVRSPIAVFPNGIYPPSEIGEKNSDGTRIAAFLSRVHPKKGLENLVIAWDQLRPENWKVQIAGNDEGGHRQEIEKIIEQRGLSEVIQFVGSIEDHRKFEFLEQADLFVLPTFSENFGVVVAEALAVGVPVITTKGAPWSELTERDCGWWIDIGVEPLVTAIREATALPAERLQAMGKNGIRLVGERYAWKAIGRSAVDTYQWLANRGAPPAIVDMPSRS